MQDMINLILKIIKWPIALLMLFLIVPATLSLVYVVSNYTSMHVFLWFGLPCVFMCIAWLFMPNMSGSFLAIMEHELTHMLFALLTFHKPVGLDVSQDRGGSFKFKGPGNWLIALAPYFFPTFAFVVMLASLAYIYLNQQLPDVYWSVFGLMVGYHLASTILETHPKQTDFKAAGVFFSFLFLPGMNLIVYGILISFACLGWHGLSIYSKILMYNVSVFIQNVI